MCQPSEKLRAFGAEERRLHATHRTSSPRCILYLPIIPFQNIPQFRSYFALSDDPNSAASGVGIGIGLGLARHTERPTLQGRSGFFET